MILRDNTMHFAPLFAPANIAFPARWLLLPFASLALGRFLPLARSLLLPTVPPALGLLLVAST